MFKMFLLTLCFLFQCCEKVGSDEHNDFVHLVGDWVLLDRRGGSSIGKGFSSSVLVRAMI